MATKLLFKLFGLGLYLLTTSYYGFATDKGDYFAATETTQSLTINNVDFTKFSYSSIWRQRSKKANYVKEFKVSSQTQTDTWFECIKKNGGYFIESQVWGSDNSALTFNSFNVNQDYVAVFLENVKDKRDGAEILFFNYSNGYRGTIGTGIYVTKRSELEKFTPKLNERYFSEIIEWFIDKFPEYQNPQKFDKIIENILSDFDKQQRFKTVRASYLYLCLNYLKMNYPNSQYYSTIDKLCKIVNEKAVQDKLNEPTTADAINYLLGVVRENVAQNMRNSNSSSNSDNSSSSSTESEQKKDECEEAENMTIPLDNLRKKSEVSSSTESRITYITEIDGWNFGTYWYDKESNDYYIQDLHKHYYQTLDDCLRALFIYKKKGCVTKKGKK